MPTLIWREINVLEEAYVANQRNLANVAHEMDGLLQFRHGHRQNISMFSP